jgi:hypothetical protein
MDDKVYNEPSEARAMNGTVSVEGPDGVSVLLTPDAATETSDRLFDAAVTAQGQRVQERPNPEIDANKAGSRQEDE